jgi:hypothetical protein
MFAKDVKPILTVLYTHHSDFKSEPLSLKAV